MLREVADKRHRVGIVVASRSPEFVDMLTHAAEAGFGLAKLRWRGHRCLSTDPLSIVLRRAKSPTVGAVITFDLRGPVAAR